MGSISRFDTEKYLLETLERIARNRSAYRILYVNISKLKPKNRHPKFVKIIARLFDNLVAIANGTMFVLANGDLVVLGKNITPKVVEDAVDQLRRALITDPIWTAHSSNEFTKVYEPDEFDALSDQIEQMIQTKMPIDLLAYRYPLDAGQIDAVKARLDEINIVDLIKHQGVLRFETSTRFELMFEEFFVAVKDLSKRFDQNIDLTGNKWLFLYLTQTLDKKTMYSFLFSDIRNKPAKVSLNLNLSTIFQSEFEDFIKRLSDNNQKLVAEVQVMDILTSMTAYFDAKELLHRHGHEILIDAASLELLQSLNIEKLEADYIKIFWHALMDEYAGDTAHLKDTMNKVGHDKFILAKCLDEKAVRWGVKNGIRAFQGPYIDKLQTALIRSKCPNAKFCSAEDCLKRKRLIAGSFRDECRYKDILESAPE